MLVDDDQFSKNPATKARLPKNRLRRPAGTFLTLSECQKLISECDGRDSVILRLMIVFGLRPSELFGLRANDVAAGRLRIDGTVVDGHYQRQTKTQGARDSIPMPEPVMTILQECMRASEISGDGLMFPSSIGTPMSSNNYLKRSLKEIGIRAGVPDLPHQILRRTFATHFQQYASVKSAQAVLRHADPEMTLGYYQQING